MASRAAAFLSRAVIGNLEPMAERTKKADRHARDPGTRRASTAAATAATAF
jgi:hypothetical protein